MAKVTIYGCFEEWKQQCMIPDHLDHASSFNEFTVAQATKRLLNEISLYGHMTNSIKPGDYLSLQTDWSNIFKVKGIENLSFIDKPKDNLNPWVIIHVTNQPEDFIGKKFYH